MAEPHLDQPLTDQELAVLRGVVEGKTDQQIAQELSVGVGAVKARRMRLHWTLRQPDRTSLAAHAIRAGLLPPLSDAPPS